MPASASKTRKGTSSVSELLAPLRLRSGATTVTSASVRRASRRRRMPSERKPSSLLTSIFTGPVSSKGQCLQKDEEGGCWGRQKARYYTGSTFAGGSVNRKPDDNDTHLFREAVRDVKPLAHDAPVPETRRPPARARFT